MLRAKNDTIRQGSTPVAHVWCFDCDDSCWPIQDLLLSLPSGTVIEAENFGDLRTRRRIVVQAALRRLLSARLNGAEPSSIVLTNGPFGKPRLADFCGPFFNVSHSRGIAAIAISDTVPIGIDVEHVLPIVDDINASVLTQHESRAIAALPDGAKLSAFYRCWVRKEAILKAHGAGLSLVNKTSATSPMASIEIPVEQRPTSTPHALPEALGDPLRWTLLDYSPCDGVAGSVAIPSPGAELKNHGDVRRILMCSNFRA